MTVSLITGGSGFIGQHLVDRLLADGETVRILDLEPPETRSSDVIFIQGSVTDVQVVREAVEGVSHLYHIAAIPHLWIPDPAMFEETNVVGTRIALEAALAAGIERVVHTSSATVLIDDGIGPGTTTLDERYHTSENRLAGHYARSKWRAERLALSFADRLSIVAVLPTLPLGPGDRHFTPPGRMLLDFANGKTRAYADCILNIIDVRDVAAGHHLACTRGRRGQRYILNSHSLRMPSFLEHLEALTGRSMPTLRVPGAAALMASAAMEFWSTMVSGRPPIAPFSGTRMGLRPAMFDGSLARTELGLSSTPLDRTLSDALAWLSDQGYLAAAGGGRVPLFDR